MTVLLKLQQQVYTNMRKFHSYILPKLNRQQNLQSDIQGLNEFDAQQSLIQISKNDYLNHHQNDNFMKELERLNNKKRYSKSSMSEPKKKISVDMPTVHSKPIYQTFYMHNLNQETIGLTNYVVIDNRRHRKSETEQIPLRSDKMLLHQQINRKAKYLFRTRNKNKTNSLPTNQAQIFSTSFYCSKIASAREYN